MAEKKQMTAKELLDKYENDVAELQRTCKHEKISDWMIVREIHGNDTGVKYKQCEICWTKLEYKAPCEACGKEYTYTDGKRDWTASQLCPECMKKGKYYCWTHKQVHSNPHGCPACIKIFERAEKRDKLKEQQKKRKSCFGHYDADNIECYCKECRDANVCLNEKDAKKQTICPKCGLPPEICVCKEIEAQDEARKKKRES